MRMGRNVEEVNNIKVKRESQPSNATLPSRKGVSSVLGLKLSGVSFSETPFISIQGYAGV